MTMPNMPSNPAAGSAWGSGFEPTPTTEMQQKTAAALNLKDMLMLKPNTDNTLLTDLDPRNRQKTGDGYGAQAENPVLDHHLEIGFAPTTLDKSASKGWQPIYEELFSKLPSDMQAILNEEKKLPFNERSGEFVIMGSLLENTAKALAQLGIASSPPIPGGTQEAREKNILGQGQAAIATTILLGGEANASVMKYLEHQGANIADFDAMNRANAELHAHLKELDIKGQENTKSELNQLAGSLQNLAGELGHSMTSGDMKILPNLAAAFSVVANASTLDNPMQFIALHSATAGMLSHDTQSALSGLTRSLFPEMSAAGQQNMVQLMTFGLAVSAGVTSLMGNQDLGSAGRLPSGEDMFAIIPGLLIASSLTSASVSTFGALPSFGFFETLGFAALALMPLLFGDTSDAELNDRVDHSDLYYLNSTAALSMIIETGFVETFIKNAIISSGGNQKSQDIATPILTELTHFLMALSAVRQHGRKSLDDYIEDHRASIAKALALAEEVTKEATPAISIVIRQLQGALNQQKYQDFSDLAVKLLSGEYTEDGDEKNTKSFLSEFDNIRMLLTEIKQDALFAEGQEATSGPINLA